MAHGMYYNSLYLALIPLLPLLGAIINGLSGAAIQARLDKSVIHVTAVATVVLSFVLSSIGFAKLALDPSVTAIHAHAWTFLAIGRLTVDAAFIMDRLSAVMCLVVTFVGSLIHIYSIGYMKNDPGYWRFFAYLNLFMFSMLVLVLGDNFLIMFMGWEGVGLCSYLLIGFWYKDINNARAGMKAFIVNRVGDFGFVIGIFLLFWTLASLPSGSSPAGHASLVFHEIEATLMNPAIRQAFTGNTLFHIPAITLICIALFVGAMGKSAQIPLYVWLPDAMAGPTPVSALIHAATMVTAGVYMVARLHFLFSLSSAAMTWVAIFGAVTAIFAAVIGFFQHDIKKVLAYSTISQLGFMFIGVGVGAYSAGIFHLVTHAFFKSCLFLCAGSVIMGCRHEQDMRKMGGLSIFMPRTNLAYLMACFAVSGFPFFSGFFSKDEILYQAFITRNMLYPRLGIFIWGIAVLAAFGTAYYMFRSYFMIFTGPYQGDQSHIPEEQSQTITFVILLLAFFSAVAGFLGMPEIFGVPNLFQDFLNPVFESSKPYLHFAHGSLSLEWLLMGMSVILALAGAFIASRLYKDAVHPLPEKLLFLENKIIRLAYDLIYHKFYIDELYQRTAVRLVMTLKNISNWTDQHIIDALVNFAALIGKLMGNAAGTADAKGVDGIVNAAADMVFTAGSGLVKIQTGRLRHYLGVALAGGGILVIGNYIFFT